MAPPRRLHPLRHRHLPRRRVLLHRRHTRLDRSGGSTHTAFERGERRLGKADCRRCRPEQPSSLIAPSQSSSLVAPPSSLLLLARPPPNDAGRQAATTGGGPEAVAPGGCGGGRPPRRAEAADPSGRESCVCLCGGGDFGGLVANGLG